MDADPFVATLQTWLEISNRYSMRTFLRQAREGKFSMSHLGALFYIHRCGSCGVTEVGEHLGVTSAAASQLLERLVEQGLVVREEDADDRRVKRIELTEKGRRAFETILHAREGWMHDVASMLTGAEKDAITKALGLLISRVALLNQDVPAAS